MSSIIAFLQAHQTISTLVAYYIASAFIGSLPAPEVGSSQFYRFIFAFLNTLGANLSRAYSSKLPVAAAQATGLADAQEAQGQIPNPPREVPKEVPIATKP
jgi:hypothetical protein